MRAARPLSLIHILREVENGIENMLNAIQAGVLTRELAKRAAKVVSIEGDERLPPLLAETMAGVDNLKLVLQDVLKVDLKALIAE